MMIIKRTLSCTRYYYDTVPPPQLRVSHFQAQTPSEYRTLYPLLEACRLDSDFTTAIKLHTIIVKLGYESYPSLMASLISTYLNSDRFPRCGSFDLVNANITLSHFMKTGHVHMATTLFSKMPSPDVVSWNSMISGFLRNSCLKDLFVFFKDMLFRDIEPDEFTFASIFKACAQLGAPSYAEWAHSVMIHKRVPPNFILSSALIDMYSKCGRIRTARAIFDSGPRENVSIWNAMINGLAIHGFASDAITIFSHMETENVLPDSITFVAIIMACSHCGLVQEGHDYFDRMTSHYSIKPEVQHYGAMVDLMGRAGLLEEAYALIKAMPMDPDVVIWRALLSACKTHRKSKIGEVAVAKISSPDSGDYVLLSNIYCSVNNWKSAERVRELMKNKGVHKNRGKSWVELSGVIHQFKAGDRSHRETEAIYILLEGLIRRTKLEGFTSSTELVLMDVSEEEKEENLNYHSEKLALAFGVLKTIPGTCIRVSKNLRICNDCHFWMKIVSRVLSRVIIVRDRIRFHNFEAGSCSCRDYW